MADNIARRVEVDKQLSLLTPHPSTQYYRIYQCNGESYSLLRMRMYTFTCTRQNNLEKPLELEVSQRVLIIRPCCSDCSFRVCTMYMNVYHFPFL